MKKAEYATSTSCANKDASMWTAALATYHIEPSLPHQLLQHLVNVADRTASRQVAAHEVETAVLHQQHCIQASGLVEAAHLHSEL